MKRSFIAAVCMLALGLGSSGTALAQVVYDSAAAPAAGVPSYSSYSSPLGTYPSYGGLPLGYYSPFGSTVYSPFGMQTSTPFGYGSQYTVPSNGGLNTSANYYSPYGSQTFSNFYSPFSFANRTAATSYSPYGTQALSSYYTPYGGMFSQTNTNLFGGSVQRTFGYNPFNGITYGTGANAITTPTIINPSYGLGGSNFGGYNNAYSNLLNREAYANSIASYDALLNQQRSATGSYNYSDKYSGSYNSNGTTASWSYNNKLNGGYNGGNWNFNHTISSSSSGNGLWDGGHNYNYSNFRGRR